MSLNKKISEADLAMVRFHLNALAEHFDSVQIFVTRCEEGQLGGTIHISLGSGNWFCRYGQTRQWVIQEDEESRIKVRQANDKKDEP